MFRAAWAWAVGRRPNGPATIGQKPHDCALTSLYWAVPRLSESKIVEAFGFCAATWPYGGVTNKEFSVALKYLDIAYTYSDKTETLGDLLGRRPTKAVALLHGHFISIHRGRVDESRNWPADTTVYCCWTFRLQRFRRAEIARRIASGTT